MIGRRQEYYGCLSLMLHGLDVQEVEFANDTNLNLLYVRNVSFGYI